MAYTLKKNVENFIMVDGPYKGKEYVHGQQYEEAPPGEKDRFDEVRVVKAVVKPADKPKAVVVKKKDASEGDKSARVAGTKKDIPNVPKPAGPIRNPKPGVKGKK